MALGRFKRALAVLAGRETGGERLSTPGIDTTVRVPRPPAGDTWRTAVVGIGGWGRAHAAYLAALDGVELVAIADLDPAARARLPSHLAPPEVAHHDDLDALLAAHHATGDRRLDLLTIATSSRAHAPLAQRAIAAGVPRLIIEKPIGTHLGEVDALLAAAAQADTRLSVNLARRWSADHRAIRAYLARSELGPVRHVSAILGRGGFGMAGIHFLDLMAYYFDDATIECVRGRLLVDPATAAAEKAEHDPPGWGVIELAGGGRGFIDASPDLERRERFVVVRCTHGRVEIDEVAQTWHVVDATGRRHGHRFVEPASAGTWLRRHLAEALADTPSAGGGLVGRAALEAVLALHASDRRGGAPVTLPLTGDDRDLMVQCR